MRQIRWYLMVALCVAATSAWAQERAPARPRVEELRRRFQERLASRVQEELALSDAQMTRLRATVHEYGGRRRQMEAEQRRLRQGLVAQLRPGVAADRDSVARMLEGLTNLRVRYAETYRAEQREMAEYLDPVQRARLTGLRDRLLQRVEEFRERRETGGAPSRRRLMDR
jgi:hypothetical protein